MRLFLMICFILFIGLATSAEAQSRKEKYDDDYDRGATYEIKATNKEAKKNKSKNSIDKSYDKKIEEYEERLEANSKKYKKISKEMNKPQFNDPTYFGHKRPPRKRPPGKKKFCKQ
ncbi:hypothetical protein ACFLU5_13445, partial [Bacteroidota bacterium]